MRWKPEIERYCHSAKVFLVGNKLDLRIEGNENYVTYKEGLRLAKEIKADAFYETSALNFINIRVITHLLIFFIYFSLINTRNYSTNVLMS